jgi:hypothetical protein
MHQITVIVANSKEFNRLLSVHFYTQKEYGQAISVLKPWPP